MDRRLFLHGAIATGLGASLGCTGWMSGTPTAGPRRHPDMPPIQPPAPGARAIGKTGWFTGLNDLRGEDEWGNPRRAALYIPTDYDDAQGAPLLIGLHGAGGNGPAMFEHNRLAATCEERGIVGLFPNLLNETLSDDGTKVDPAMVEQDWTIDLIAKTAKRLNIDQHRVWLVGFSMGGRRAYRLAAVHSERIAAIAVVGSMMGYVNRSGTDDRWHPDVTRPRPVSVLHIHGQADTRVPMSGRRNDYEDGVTGIPTHEALQIWARHIDGVEQDRFQPPSPAPSQVTGRHWTAPSRHRVMGLFVPGLAHEWPAAWANTVIADFLGGAPART